MKSSIIHFGLLALIFASTQAQATLESSDFNKAIDTNSIEQRGVQSQIEKQVTMQTENGSIASETSAKCLAGYDNEVCDHIQAELALHKKGLAQD